MSDTKLETGLLGRPVVRKDGKKRGVIRTAALGPHGVTYQVETEEGTLENTDLSSMSIWRLEKPL